jgi:hypothetical protein
MFKTMCKTMQIKLLAGILAVLTLIAGLLVHANRSAKDEMLQRDEALEKKVNKAMAPSTKPYLIP